MPSPATKIRAAFKLVGTFMILLVVIAIAMALFSGQERRLVHLPDGGVIRLEGYAFQSNNVRYEFANHRIIRGFARVLPAWVKNRVKWLSPEVTSVVSPSFSREAVLSAAFSLRDPSGKSGRAGTRIAVSDDRGQLFDSALNYLGNQGVFEAKAFPRRGKDVRLRLMEDEKLLAEFKIPNPCPGPHPRWTAQPTPFTVTNAGLEITLERFAAQQAAWSGRGMARPVCISMSSPPRHSGRALCLVRPRQFA